MHTSLQLQLISITLSCTEFARHTKNLAVRMKCSANGLLILIRAQIATPKSVHVQGMR